MPERIPRKRGALAVMLDELDRSGRIGRNALTGNWGAVGRNLLGWNAPRPGESPSFTKKDMTGEEHTGLPYWGGLAADVATDPLTWITAGGAGAAKALATAGTKQVAKQFLRKGLTKAGEKWVAEEGAKEAAKLLAERTGKSFGKLAPTKMQRIGENRVLERLLRKNPKGGYVLEAGSVPAGTLEQGGLKVGLPFTRGTTIPGTAGIDLSPTQIAGLAGKLPIGQGMTLGKYLGKTFKFGHGLKPEELNVARDYEVAKTLGRTESDEWLSKLAGELPRGLTDDDGFALIAKWEGVDLRPAIKAGALKQSKIFKKWTVDPSKLTPEVVAEMKASGEQLSKLVDQDPALFKVWQRVAEKHRAIWNLERERGIAEGQLPFEQYLKRLYANAPEVLEAQGRKPRFEGGAGVQKGFTQERKYTDIVDAMKAGFAPSTNPFENIRARLHGHVDALASDTLRRRAKVLRSQDKTLKGEAISKLQEWIDEGAGRIKPRGPVMSGVAAFNRVWKPLNTAGFILPTPSFHLRNIVSGRFQEATNERARLLDVLKPWSLKADRVLAAIKNPERAKNVPGLKQYSGPELVEAVKQSGLLGQTFATTEDLMGTGGGGKLLRALNLLPGKAMQRIEGNMRIGMFLRQLEQGQTPRAAADAARQAFVDYTMVSAGQRNLRDLIPFAQFKVGQTPTTLETIMKRPRFATPVRELRKRTANEDQGVLPAHLQAQPVIPFGRTEAGPRYLTQLGTIFDDLNTLYAGNIPDTIRQSVLGQMSPLVKTPLELATNKDFFFGGNIDYNKTPEALQALGMGETMDPRLRKLVQSLPGARQLGMVDKVLDERQAWWQKAVNLLTGVKIETIDQARAYRKLMQAYIEERVAAGDVGVMQRFYSKSMDPLLAERIRQYNRQTGKKR